MNEHSHGKFDFNQRPFLVIWESTRACDLACVHCRASADPKADPDELNTAEAVKLINDVRELDVPIFIFSGGDCLKRTDLYELINYTHSKKIKAGAIPAVTPNLNESVIRKMKANGLSQIAFSLDAANAEEHDSFRRTTGVFDHTLKCVQWANELQLPVQINSLVNIHNLDRLSELMNLIEGLDIVFWEVFFLVPIGRGKEIPLLDAEKFDRAFEKIYEFSQRVPFITKITEAQHYRRYSYEKSLARDGLSVSRTDPSSRPAPIDLSRVRGPKGSIGQAPHGVNSGKGFAFISYRGDVMPSGFLPISAGNIREQSLKSIYQNHPLFRSLRDSSLLRGRCGICSYKDICGGSRARAYSLTGDYLAEDPCCSYQK